uniref:Keratin, type I cytoskeletal 10-like n=1 Tax=Cicer arietinum TaxID=3827 RepID=A0A1S2XF94_CICAR|nr:keratin, type I cytoskeletal 10-like [Cicer arietinum]
MQEIDCNYLSNFDNSLVQVLEEVSLKEECHQYIDFKSKEKDDGTNESLFKQVSEVNEAMLVLEGDWSRFSQNDICKKIIKSPYVCDEENLHKTQLALKPLQIQNNIWFTTNFNQKKAKGMNHSSWRQAPIGSLMSNPICVKNPTDDTTNRSIGHSGNHCDGIGLDDRVGDGTGRGGSPGRAISCGGSSGDGIRPDSSTNDGMGCSGSPRMGTGRDGSSGDGIGLGINSSKNGGNPGHNHNFGGTGQWNDGSFQIGGNFREFYNNDYYDGYGNIYEGSDGFGMGGNNQSSSLQVNEIN